MVEYSHYKYKQNNMPDEDTTVAEASVEAEPLADEEATVA